MKYEQKKTHERLDKEIQSLYAQLIQLRVDLENFTHGRSKERAEFLRKKYDDAALTDRYRDIFMKFVRVKKEWIAEATSLIREMEDYFKDE